MKLLTGIIAVLFLTSNPLFGQGPEAAAGSGTTLAIRGGLTMSTVGTDEDTDPGIGMNAGASIGFQASDRIGIQLGIAYVQKGFRVPSESTTASGSGSTPFDLNYIEFSALGRFDVPMGGGGSSIHMLVGPALAFKSKCVVKNTPFGDIDCGEDTKSQDVGVAAGAGVVMPVSEQIALSADLVYTLGLQSFAKEEEEDYKNRALNAWLGVVFSLGE